MIQDNHIDKWFTMMKNFKKKTQDVAYQWNYFDNRVLSKEWWNAQKILFMYTLTLIRKLCYNRNPIKKMEWSW